MKLLIILLLTIGCSFYFNMKKPALKLNNNNIKNIADFKWKNRLLININHKSDISIRDIQNDDLSEYNLQIVDVKKDKCIINNITIEANLFFKDSIFYNYLKENEISLLVGYDGKIKKNYTMPISINEVYQLINTMPMRINENKN